MHSVADIENDILGLKTLFNYLRDKSEIFLDLIKVFSRESEGRMEIATSDGLSNSFITEAIKDFMVLKRGLEFDGHDSHGDNYFNYSSFFDEADGLLIVSFINSTTQDDAKKLVIKFDKYPK